MQRKRMMQVRRTLFARVLMLVAVTALLASLAARPAQAQNACVKSIGTSPVLNGVVAGGAAGSGCAVDASWQGVSPVELWAGSSPSSGLAPGGYLYFAFRDSAGTTNDRLWIGLDVGGDDNLTNWDVVYLLFDADKSGSWNAGDFFIKVPASVSSTLINSGGLCSQACGEKEYWEHNGTTWQQVAGVGTAINTSVAYDYETTIDAEKMLWNLEIDMPVARLMSGVTRFNLKTAAPYFAMGAYVFVDRNHIEAPNPKEGTVLRWPQTMVDRTITQQNLFGIPASQPSELGGVSLTNTCFDVNFAVSDPWRVNDSIGNSYDNRIIRNGVNTFRVKFRYQGPDGGTGSTPNPGQVKLALTPYNATTGTNTTYTKTKTVTVSPTPTSFPGEYTADISFNFGSPAESWSAFESAYGQVSFLCARMTLQNFTRDDVASNNEKVVNHNEFTTSEYTHELAVFGDDIRGIAPGERRMLRIRLQPMNDPVSERRGGGGMDDALTFIGTPDFTALWLLAAAIGIAVAAFGRRRTVAVRGGYAMLGAAMLLAGCQQAAQVVRPLQPAGEQRWDVPNGDRVGLRPIRGEPGWYEMPIAGGEVKRLQMRFRGRPLPYRTNHQRLAPMDSAGRMATARYDVKPGQVVTVVAFGRTDVDGPNGPLPPTSPTGFTLPEEAPRSARAGLPLRRGYYDPTQHVGALIGTFDNWEHSFVVGRAGSFVVPEEGGTLQLAVNAPQETLRMMTGEYEVNVITTVAPRAPTRTATRGDATYRIPVTYDPWRVLTSLNVYTYDVIDDPVDEGRLVGRTLRPMGEAHYSIYASHVGNER